MSADADLWCKPFNQLAGYGHNNKLDPKPNQSSGYRKLHGMTTINGLTL
jgi:hypothetical protein